MTKHLPWTCKNIRSIFSMIPNANIPFVGLNWTILQKFFLQCLHVDALSVACELSPKKHRTCRNVGFNDPYTLGQLVCNRMLDASKWPLPWFDSLQLKTMETSGCRGGLLHCHISPNKNNRMMGIWFWLKRIWQITCSFCVCRRKGI